MGNVNTNDDSRETAGQNQINKIAVYKHGMHGAFRLSTSGNVMNYFQVEKLDYLHSNEFIKLNAILRELK
jgi:hypothetical protein